MVIVDIWGGEFSMDHVARHMVNMPEALKVAEFELKQGYLVNLRYDASFGPNHSFDNRTIGAA